LLNSPFSNSFTTVYTLWATENPDWSVLPMQLTEDEVTRLSPEERLLLIEQLWDSLEDSQVELSATQKAELERRLGSLDIDRSRVVSWAALKEELERRCP
jgi:putative addiction module component (TIGR02574 family)